MKNVASIVISKLGGFAAVSSGIGVDKTWVHRWTYPRSRGGTGGVIPQRHFSDLLKFARARGVELTVADLVAVEQQPALSVGAVGEKERLPDE